MLFSSTYASESYGRTDRGRLHSPDSGGNFRVVVMRHAFHLAQILRAQTTRSQVSFFFSLLSWGRTVRRTLKPETPLEPLMESSRSAATESIRSFSWIFWIFRARKVQKFTASFSSSELSAHQMAPGGVIPHWRSPCALVPPSSSMPLLHPRCRKSYLNGRRVRLRCQRHRS